MLAILFAILDQSLNITSTTTDVAEKLLKTACLTPSKQQFHCRLLILLQGPILAATFGQVIRKQDLRNLGLKSELKGLALCLIVGKYKMLNHISHFI